MKKFTLLALGLLLAFGAQAATEFYAAISGKTMTVYYDDQRVDRSGKKAPTGENTGWLTFDKLASVTTVDFDKSVLKYTATSTAYWFDGMSALTTINNLQRIDTRQVTTMERMFRGCEKLTAITFNDMYFITTRVTNMHAMFHNCKALTNLDLSMFTSDVLTDVHAMFLNCFALKTIKFGNYFTTELVTDFGQMFDNCKALKTLDINLFEVSSAKRLNKMFYDCAALTTIKADYAWLSVAPASATSDEMFNGCNALKGANGTTYSTSHWDITYARPDEAGTPGYFTKSACPKPRFITATQITPNSATITWTSESKHLRWSIEYNFEGQEGINTEETISNSITLNDLRPNTTYSIRVQGDCSSSKTSEWSEYYEFKTLPEGQGINLIQPDKERGTKIIRNGQLFIQINGHLYNALGSEVE